MLARHLQPTDVDSSLIVQDTAAYVGCLSYTTVLARLLIFQRYRKTQEKSKDFLTVTDSRTGKTYEIPIKNNTINALALKDIAANGEGLM